MKNFKYAVCQIISTLGFDVKIISPSTSRTPQWLQWGYSGNPIVISIKMHSQKFVMNTHKVMVSVMRVSVKICKHHSVCVWFVGKDEAEHRRVSQLAVSIFISGQIGHKARHRHWLKSCYTTWPCLNVQILLQYFIILSYNFLLIVVQKTLYVLPTIPFSFRGDIRQPGFLPRFFSPFCHRWSFGSLPLSPLAS